MRGPTQRSASPADPEIVRRVEGDPSDLNKLDPKLPIVAI